MEVKPRAATESQQHVPTFGGGNDHPRQPGAAKKRDFLLHLCCLFVAIAFCLLLISTDQHRQLRPSVPTRRTVAASVVTDMLSAKVQLALALPNAACRIHNRVAAREDNINVNFDVDRPWSVTKWSFPLTANDATARPHLCESTLALAAAVRNGRRVWLGGDQQSSADDRPETSLQRERHQSFFRPHGCSVPSFDSARACGVLQRYDSIVLIGDSLLRHVHQGLLLATSGGDWEWGAWPGPRTAAQQRDCSCDGSFSEVAWCRDWKGIMNGRTEQKWRSQRSCSAADHGRVQRLAASEATKDTLITLLCNGSGRKIVVLNGGIHYKYMSFYFEHTFLREVLSRLETLTAECTEPPKLGLVYLTAGSQSRQLDRKYPHQSRENTKAFNHDVEAYLSACWPAVDVLNWWNLTKDAQTSDGQHFLTDVNLAKAHVLLRHMELAVSENGVPALHQSRGAYCKKLETANSVQTAEAAKHFRKGF